MKILVEITLPVGESHDAVELRTAPTIDKAMSEMGLERDGDSSLLTNPARLGLPYVLKKDSNPIPMQKILAKLKDIERIESTQQVAAQYSPKVRDIEIEPYVTN